MTTHLLRDLEGRRYWSKQLKIFTDKKLTIFIEKLQENIKDILHNSYIIFRNIETNYFIIY